MNDLMQCVNRKCKRHRIGITSGAKRCDECGRKLKPFYSRNGHEPGEFDTPPDNYSAAQGRLLPAGFFNGFRGKYVGKGFAEAYQHGRDTAAGITVIQPQLPAKVEEHHEDSWSTECSDIKGCPIATAPKIEIPLKIYNEWIFLCRQFDTEWIAYGTSVQQPNGNRRIVSYYFPKQYANGAHVDAEDGEIQEGTNFAVHSHVDMQAFFSGEDTKHFNHDTELVINQRGNMDANVRITLECGKPSRKNTDLVVVECEQDPMWNLKLQLQAKLTKEQPAVSTNWNNTTGQPTQQPS